MSKEGGTRVKDRAKNGGSKRAGRGWVSFLPLPLPSPSFIFCYSFISRAVKTENPLPRSFLVRKPNGNACYAGQSWLLRRHRKNDTNGIDDKKKSVYSFQFHELSTSKQKPIAPQRPQSFHWLLTVATAC